jgi:hypothetical protein
MSPNFPASRALFPNTGNLIAGLTGNGALGNMASSIMPFMNVGQGIAGLLQSRKLKQQMMALAQTQDPFGSQRGQYQQQLAGLMKDPSSIMTDPAYLASVQAANRGMAASGYLGSGNQLVALKDNFANFYNQRIGQLAPLAGAQFGPGNSGAIAAQGLTGSLQLQGNAINNLAYGASRLLS